MACLHRDVVGRPSPPYDLSEEETMGKRRGVAPSSVLITEACVVRSPARVPHKQARPMTLSILGGCRRAATGGPEGRLR